MRYRVTNQSKIDWVRFVCRIAAGGHEESKNIPFETPVSMTEETVLNPDSVASFKADGTRFYLILTTHDGRNIACLVDRFENVWSIEVHASVDMFAMGIGSVFDGEWCSYSSDGSHRLLLIFNTLMDRGLPFFGRPYRSRLAAVTRNFPQSVLTLSESKQSLGFVQARHPCLHILAKPYFPCVDIVRQAKIGCTMFSSDGFVITPLESYMTTGRNYQLLKFKAVQTIDLLTTEQKNGEISLFAMDKGTIIPTTTIISCYLPQDDALKKVLSGYHLYHKLVLSKSPCPPFQQIVEYMMYPDMETRCVRLEYVRIRTDKDRPNDALTIRGTVDSAMCNLTIDNIADRIADLQKHHGQTFQ